MIIKMNKKIVCLTLAVCTLIAVLCSCTSSKGDSLLEVVAGVKGESSEVSSMAPSSSVAPSSSSEAPSSSSEAQSIDESLDIVYPETNYSTARTGWVATETDPLTLRSHPSSSDYETVVMIPKGAKITVKGATGNFLFVEYDKKLGYVSKQYVSFDELSSASSSTATSSESADND